MKMSVTERLLVLGMREIPRIGNIVTMRLVTDLFARVSFTEEEIERGEIKFTMEPSGKSNVRWNPLTAVEAEIDLTPGMIGILVESMEKAQELPLAIISVYDRLKAMIPVVVFEEKK